MERTFINEIRENDLVEGIFWVKEKATPVSRTGAPYLRVRLADRTGEIEGRVWDGVEEFADLFERDDFIRIKAQATSYQDRVQLNIKSIKKVEEAEVSLDEFLPSSARDPDEMLAELVEISQGIENDYLKKLVMAFLENEEFTLLFKRAPGAKRLHHSFLGWAARAHPLRGQSHPEDQGVLRGDQPRPPAGRRGPARHRQGL